jgi:FAD:protein FMN transferase
MGTRIELHQFGPGAAEGLRDARRLIEAVDDALTIHRPSPATALNERLMAGEGAVIDDPLLFDALLGIDVAWAATGGLFDPTVGAGSAGNGAGRWDAITIDRDDQRIEVSRPVAIDFGGFGKGYALDRACDAMRAAGVVSAMLSAGESSIAVIGVHPLGGAWPIAVPHPYRPDDWLAELALEDASLSVSATIGGGAAAPGRAGMVRPGDGATISEAVTTIAIETTGAMAEAMSTALLVAPPEIAGTLVAARPDARHRFLFPRVEAGASPVTGSVA